MGAAFVTRTRVHFTPGRTPGRARNLEPALPSASLEQLWRAISAERGHGPGTLPSADGQSGTRRPRQFPSRTHCAPRQQDQSCSRVVLVGVQRCLHVPPKTDSPAFLKASSPDLRSMRSSTTWAPARSAPPLWPFWRRGRRPACHGKAGNHLGLPSRVRRPSARPSGWQGVIEPSRSWVLEGWVLSTLRATRS